MTESFGVPAHGAKLLSGIRARLLLLVLLAIAPPIALVGYNAFEAREAAISEARHDVSALARLAVEQLSSEIYAARYMQGAIAQIPAVRRGVEPACSAALADLLQRTRRYTGLAIARRDGVVICSGQPRVGTVTYSDRQYFQTTLQSGAPTVGKPVIGKISGKAQVPLAYPLLDAKGKIERVVVTGVDLARFADQFAENQQLPKASFTIWDEAGTVFYRNPDNGKWFGHAIPGALRSAVGTTVTSGVDGIVRVYGSAALNAYPEVALTISVGVPEAELVQLANSALKRSLMLLGLVAGLALAGSLLLSERYVRRPVADLVAAARRIGGGDLDEPILVPKGGGDLGVLAHALESMRDEVRTREVKLRKLVEELRIANESVVHSEARLRGILESAMDAIVTVDESQRIVLFNAAAEGIFGCTHEEAIGTPLARFIPERFRLAHAAHIDDFSRQGTPARPMGRDRIVTGLRRNGEEFPIDASISQISEGGNKYYTVILRDVTERVRAQQALQRTILDLRQFAYAASHDLRTPLRSISGFAQLLQKKSTGRLDEEAGDWIARVVAGAHRMERLIEDLLSYARLESQDRHLVPVDCAAVFDDAVQLLEGEIRDTRAEVTSGPLPTVMGEQGQLVQLFQNLIGNAVKYHGPRPPRIHVSAQRQDGAWVFSVSDNGIGIEPGQHHRIFEIFRRLHTQSEYPGTGIGLAVCRRIVEQHGGAIWVESEPDEGSTFFFTIPDCSEVKS